MAILILEARGFTGISDRDWAAGITGGILCAGFIFLFRILRRAGHVGAGHKDGA